MIIIVIPVFITVVPGKLAPHLQYVVPSDVAGPVGAAADEDLHLFVGGVVGDLEISVIVDSVSLAVTEAAHVRDLAPGQVDVASEVPLGVLQQVMQRDVVV